MFLVIKRNFSCPSLHFAEQSRLIVWVFARNAIPFAIYLCCHNLHAAALLSVVMVRVSLINALSAIKFWLFCEKMLPKRLNYMKVDGSERLRRRTMLDFE